MFALKFVWIGVGGGGSQVKLEATDGPRNIIGIMLPERSAEMVCDALRGFEVRQD